VDHPSPGDVRNNEAKSRFEIDVPGDEVGIAEYRLLDDRIIFIHTFVPHADEHHGFGGALAEAGLAFARRNGLKVVPRCPFFAAYIARHPEHQDLVLHEA
jgi:predicted GNAT family acetyltransferase